MSFEHSRKIYIFPKELTHDFGKKIKISFESALQGRELYFYDVVYRKKGFLDYQISFSHNRKICILPKSISIKLVSISIGKSSILIENTTFFLY